MTHFARAEEDRRACEEQLATFDTACAGLPYLRSIANSAGVVRFGEVGGDIVRPGIMLYGATPFPHDTAERIGLQPVMTLRSEIIAVQELARRRQRRLRRRVPASPRRIGSASSPAATPTAIRGTRRTAHRCSSAASECHLQGACRWTW